MAQLLAPRAVHVLYLLCAAASLLASGAGGQQSPPPPAPPPPAVLGNRAPVVWGPNTADLSNKFLWTKDPTNSIYVSPIFAVQGDLLQFTYAANVHNVFQFFTKAAYDACDFSALSSTNVGGLTSATLALPKGWSYYGCSFAVHCAVDNMKVAVFASPCYSFNSGGNCTSWAALPPIPSPPPPRSSGGAAAALPPPPPSISASLQLVFASLTPGQFNSDLTLQNLLEQAVQASTTDPVVVVVQTAASRRRRATLSATVEVDVSGFGTLASLALFVANLQVVGANIASYTGKACTVSLLFSSSATSGARARCSPALAQQILAAGLCLAAWAWRRGGSLERRGLGRATTRVAGVGRRRSMLARASGL